MKRKNRYSLVNVNTVFRAQAGSLPAACRDWGCPGRTGHEAETEEFGGQSDWPDNQPTR